MTTAAASSPAYRATPGTLHTILLAGSVSLFLGAMLNDIAYFRTYEIQWSNFASWLIAGGLLFTGLALLFALVNLFRKAGRSWLYFLLLLVTWALGLINAFEHAKDAWAAMPLGLILSVVVTLLSIAATWVGLNPRERGVK